MILNTLYLIDGYDIQYKWKLNIWFEKAYYNF